jgi:SAM-dependent methyltransferase
MYLMDHAMEGERLERKTDRTFAEANLRLAGLARGMTALDVGCGSGAVARVMAAMTGAAVIGIDVSRPRIELARNLSTDLQRQLTFIEASADAIPLPDNSVDFCWSRFFFEYQASLHPALTEMLRIAKPGGTIAIADLDGQMTGFYPQPDRLRKDMDHALTLLRQVGFDAEVGRKIHAAFKHLGLDDVRVNVIPYQTYAGGLPPDALANWEAKFATVGTTLAKLDPATDWSAVGDEALRQLQRDDSLYFSTMILTTARKPRG